jgi:hypothetical protein
MSESSDVARKFFEALESFTGFLALKALKELGEKDQKGKTILHYLLNMPDDFPRNEFFETLIKETGVDLNTEDKNGYTPFMYNLMFGKKTYFEKVLKAFEEDEKFYLRIKKGDGSFPSTLCYLVGLPRGPHDLDILKKIFKKERHLSIAEKDEYGCWVKDYENGWNILFYCLFGASSKYIDVSRKIFAFLCEEGCDFFDIDNSGRNIFHIVGTFCSIQHEILDFRDNLPNGVRHSDILSMLRAKDPCSGNTPAHFAASTNSKTFNFLLNLDSQSYKDESITPITNNQGLTALMVFCLNFLDIGTFRDGLRGMEFSREYINAVTPQGKNTALHYLLLALKIRKCGEKQACEAISLLLNLGFNTNIQEWVMSSLDGYYPFFKVFLTRSS